MRAFKRFFTSFFKGTVIGIGTLIPGVSGGTAAMAVGVFEDILECISNFFVHIKKSIITLLPIASGALFSIFILSPLISIFCEQSPFIAKYTFCFISLTSTFFFVKNNIKSNFSFKKTVFMFLGIVSSATVSVLISFFRSNIATNNVFVLFLIGLPLALALVLPAISFSYMMLFFGIYEKTLFALQTLDFNYLFPLFLGIVSGVFVFSKILLKLIKKHNQETYTFVFGFVIYSLCEILLK